jgi:osmotically-inducible protein OsmY
MKRAVFLTLLLVLGKASLTGHAALAGETTRDYINDAAITTNVKAIIANDRDTHYFKIEVTTTNGVVVLKGSVNSSDAEARLVKRIKEIGGVKSVKNLLKVEKNKD